MHEPARVATYRARPDMSRNHRCEPDARAEARLAARQHSKPLPIPPRRFACAMVAIFAGCACMVAAVAQLPAAVVGLAGAACFAAVLGSLADS